MDRVSFSINLYSTIAILILGSQPYKTPAFPSYALFESVTNWFAEQIIRVAVKIPALIMLSAVSVCNMFIFAFGYSAQTNDFRFTMFFSVALSAFTLAVPTNPVGVTIFSGFLIPVTSSVRFARMLSRWGTIIHSHSFAVVRPWVTVFVALPGPLYVTFPQLYHS